MASASSQFNFYKFIFLSHILNIFLFEIDEFGVLGWS